MPLLLALLLPATAIAHDFEVGGIYYNITGNNEVAVTYQGASNYSAAYSGDVVIPETVYYNGTTYSVTAIGEYAFRYCSGLTNVSIPNSVTSIGRYAFHNCTNLSNIQMPNSVTDIGYSAFDNTAWYNSYPDGPVYIGKVFYKYKGTMPEGTSFTIEDGTLGIAGDAFYNCSGMTSVNIPNTVVTISKWAFYQCTGLTSVTIPNSVITIDDYAFYSCSSLSSATIGNSVSFIGNYAFWGCPLTDISVVNGNTHYDSRGNCNAIIETASNTLILGCQNTVIPNSVTAIGNNAFLSCTGLTNITIPNSVTTIGERAFGACSELSNITIPSSVTTIGERAFYGCSGLSNIAVASGNPIYDSRDNCNGIIETASNTLICGCQSTEIPNSVIAIGDYAFYYCTELTSLTLPNSVTTIGNYAFYQCSRLTNLTLPNSLIAIGNYAFNQCTGLTSINIPNAVTSIGNYAFYNCTGLTNINIPNHVTTIGERAFMGCTGLTSLTLPSSLNTIGNYAFAGCETLNDVYSFIYYFNNDDYFSMGYEVFARGGDYSNRTLHVPRSNSGNYQQDSRWSQYFGNIVEMPSRFEVDGIYYSLINANEVAVTYDYNHKYTGNVNIPETINYEGMTYSVTAIGNEAFEGCVNLTSVSIPNSVSSIGEWAFASCTKLASINIPNSVTSIGDYAFRNCIKLANVNIPNSVTTIGEKAFAYCYSLTEITVPESVTTIDLTTFSYCYSLAEVTWNARNCMLEYSYFDDEDHLPFAFCPSLKKIIIGSEVESIDDEIFCIYDPIYNNIDTVMCLATQPPVISEDCFWTHTYENATLCVPNESVNSYASATGWKEFVHRATLEPQENILAGDVDGDGKVTIGDVADLIDYLLSGGNHVINDINADVDGDRHITIGDVADLIDKLLGKN